MTCAIEDAGWIIRDCLVWAYASGFPKSKALLKPAWEPIVMARKPGPLRELAIDACRIGTEPTTTIRSGHSGDNGILGTDHHTFTRENAGRWPANVILTDPIFDGDTPGVVGGGWQAGGGNPAWRSTEALDGSYHGNFGGGDTGLAPTDTEGTYSRFFIIPKADRAEREPVLGGLPTTDATRVESAHSTVCAKCGRQRVNVPGAACVCHDPEWVRKPQTARANHHPTVKPLDLMRHLVRLVTPVGGTVLDPFLGSGTTALAAEMEGFAWIGIEREAEYVAIAEARLNGTQRGPLVEQPGDLLARPDVVAQAGRHRGSPGIGLGEALVGPREVVVQEVAVRSFLCLRGAVLPLGVGVIRLGRRPCSS
jgi:site-specific DNA-methyltransferase (adenine-specific)